MCCGGGWGLMDSSEAFGCHCPPCVPQRGRERKPKSKGFGFVTYATVGAAPKAVLEMNGLADNPDLTHGILSSVMQFCL